MHAPDYRCVHAYRKRAFLNLRAVIEQEWSPPPDLDRIFPPDYSVGLHILRDATLATLFSILSHQFIWRYAARDTRRGSVRSISYIDLAEGATLRVGDLAAHGLFKQLQDSSLTVKIEEDAQIRRLEIIDRTLHELVRSRIETTMNTIRQIVLSPQSSSSLSGIKFILEAFVLGVWIDQVSDFHSHCRMRGRANVSSVQKIREWLKLKPDLDIYIGILYDKPDRLQFEFALRRIQNVYKDLWQFDFPRFRVRGRRSGEGPFFKLETIPSDNELCLFLFSALSRRNGRDGFQVYMEDTPARFRLRNGVREPVENAMGDALVLEHHNLDGTVRSLLDDDASDSDTTGSESGDDSSDSSSSSFRSPPRNISAGSSSDLSDITSSDESSSDEDD